jgi:hypothetical protein
MKNQAKVKPKPAHTTKDVQAAVIACEKVGLPVNLKALVQALKEAK